MKKIFVILMFCCLLGTGCGSNDVVANIKVISASEVKNIIDNSKDYSDVVIIDVRTSQEYAVKHLKGAINIPLSEIESINISVDKKIILYCQSGNRSNQAANKLIDLGYKKVYDMGGINSWIYDFESNEE